MVYSFLQAVQQQICISQSTHSHWLGYCKLYLLCRNLHRSPLRSQGTKDEILLPTPTLDIQSASIYATSSKFSKESTIQNQMSFTLQDTADTPPQMPLDNPEFTAYMSSLLKKELQNGLNRQILEKLLEVITCQATPHGNPKTVGSTVLNRSGTR